MKVLCTCERVVTENYLDLTQTYKDGSSVQYDAFCQHCGGIIGVLDEAETSPSRPEATILFPHKGIVELDERCGSCGRYADRNFIVKGECHKCRGVSAYTVDHLREEELR